MKNFGLLLRGYWRMRRGINRGEIGRGGAGLEKEMDLIKNFEIRIFGGRAGTVVQFGGNLGEVIDLSVHGQ